MRPRLPIGWVRPSFLAVYSWLADWLADWRANWRRRRRTRAGAAKTKSDVKYLETEVVDLRASIDRLDRDNADLREELEKQESAVRVADYELKLMTKSLERYRTQAAADIAVNLKREATGGDQGGRR